MDADVGEDGRVCTLAPPDGHEGREGESSDLTLSGGDHTDTRRRNRRRKRQRNDESTMDCKSEGQVTSERKKHAMAVHKDGALLCHSLTSSDDKFVEWSKIDVAKEIARCLQEPKFNLVRDAVNVLGNQRSLDLFHQTAAIQEGGGQPTADGNGETKKSPGGVFFALVKLAATQEEKRQIFRADRLQKERRRRILKKKKQQTKAEKELAERKADWQLKIFRAQLENPLDSDWDIARKVSLECDTTYTQLKRPKNVHKRLGKKSENGDETMEVEITDNCSGGVQGGGDDVPPDGGSLEKEREAAEQFELTSDINMDFNFDIT